MTNHIDLSPEQTKKTRLISIRLSEREYIELEKDRFVYGSRSLSDHARILLCKMLRIHAAENEQATDSETVPKVLRSIADEVSRLLALAASLEPRPQEPPRLATQTEDAGSMNLETSDKVAD